MNWYLFGCVTIIVFLCCVHARFEQLIKAMSEAGFGVDASTSPLLRASNILIPVVTINIYVFLGFLIFKQGWAIALLTVLGGAATALIYAFTLGATGFFDSQVSTWHKASWVVLPVLSVGIWFVLYGVLPLGQSAT